MDLNLLSIIVTLVGIIATAIGVLVAIRARRHQPIVIAVVQRKGEVLLVKPHDKNWQFPAGMIKRGLTPEVVARNEVLEETGVEVEIVGVLGKRVHPVTDADATYVRGRYLRGEAKNLDPKENSEVKWAAARDVLNLLGAGANIFPAVQDLLREIQLQHSE